MFAETIKRGVAGPFSLGSWVVEPQLNRVSNGEISVHLEPKAMEVLLCLADHPGEVVSRREIVDSVWTVEFIADSTLTHAVADLRRAFADDARAPRFIETIPKRGYRLIAGTERGFRKEPSARRTTTHHEPLAVIAGQEVRLGNRDFPEHTERFLILADREIPLAGGAIVFGRGIEADVRIVAPEVSRLHARLEFGPNLAEIVDLASKNGTLVNHTPIAGRCELRSGDTIGIGGTEMTCRWTSAEPTLTRDPP
jgi:DNA-binding winged helix-turn-helix (wHTH) protein